MDLKTFLTRILPRTGHYITAYIDPTSHKVLHSYSLGSIDDAANAVEGYKRRRLHAFVATASFGGNGRKREQKQVKAKRAFYVDIDCKEGGQYATKQEALAAVVAAIKAGLPKPSIIVDSGNGFHLYWVLTADIPLRSWEPYAKALVNCCKTTKLNIDAGITTDSARILRAPTSINFKNPSAPQLCRVNWGGGPDWTFEDLAAELNSFLTGPASVPNPVDNSDLSAGLTRKPAQAAKMVPACPLMADTLATRGANQPGQLWHRILHVLAYCEDGHSFIHAMSDGHATYDRQAVENRFAYALKQAERKDLGPTTCEKFATLSPHCQGCQWRGKMKSPIKLAFSVPSDMPWPYRNGASGVEMADGEDNWDRVIRYRVEKFQAAVDRGAATFVNFMLGGEHIDTDMSHFVDNRSTQQLLCQYGVTLDTHELEHLRRLMNAWIHQLRETSSMATMARNLGWTDRGFNYGGVIYGPNGSTTPTFRADRVMANTYEPVGDLDPWQECANHILGSDRPASWCVLASAFGAPLLRYTGATGALLSIVSQESGTGKSTAMKVAQAVWGHPKRAMASLNDTPNAISNRLGMLNTLPAYWDEVREKSEVQNFVKVIFRLSQGKDKQRLTSSIQQRQTGEWATMLVIASNEPVRDHIAKTVGNSDAGAARVFEIRANAVPPDGMDDATARHFYGRLESHYGRAGQLFAQHLATNEKDVSDLVKKYDRNLAVRFKTTGDERFWVATVASLVAGAKIATDLGICQFDIPVLTKYLTSSLLSLRRAKSVEFKTGFNKALDMMIKYLHEKGEYVAQSDRLPTRGAQGKISIMPSRYPCIARYTTADGVLRVMVEPFENWVYDREGAGFSHLIDDLMAQGAKKIRGSVDAGLPVVSGGRHLCLDIPFTQAQFAPLALSD